MRGLSLVVASRGHSSSRCTGLSLSWPLLLRSNRLQTRRLSSCGSRAQPLRGMWDLPRPGLEPVSLALAGRFSTTAPPGKPCNYFFKKCNADKIPVNNGFNLCQLIEILLYVLPSIVYYWNHYFFSSIRILRFYFNAWLTVSMYCDNKFLLSLLIDT